MILKSILSILAAAFVLSACNTMEGLGKDIQKGGAKIEKAAERKAK